MKKDRNGTTDAIIARARKAMKASVTPHSFFLGKSADNYICVDDKTAQWSIFSFDEAQKNTKSKQYYVVTLHLTTLRPGKKHQNSNTLRFGCTCPAFENDKFTYCKECLF